MTEEKKTTIGPCSMNALKRDFRLYPRESVDYNTVARFVDAMKAGAKFPPIRACAQTGRIIDGFHRFEAYSLAGVEIVDVSAEEVEDDVDFFMRAVEANKAHGLGYREVDYEKIVKITKLLGLTKERVAFAMALPVQRLESMMRATPRPAGEPVKVGTAHRAQRNYIDKAPREPEPPRTSPVGYLFFFNKVIEFLKSELCDLKNADILFKVRELNEALQHRVNPAGERLTPLSLPAPIKEYLAAWAKREGKSMVNLVVEQLTMNVEIDVDNEQCAGHLTKKEAEAWAKKIKPHSVLNKDAA